MVNAGMLVRNAAKKGDAKAFAEALGKSPSQRLLNRALMQASQYGRPDFVKT